MDQRIMDYVTEHREDIIRDWQELVNLEGSLREPEYLDIEAEWLKQKFTDAGVSCEIVHTKEHYPPLIRGVLGEDRPGKPVIFAGHFDTVFDRGTFGDHPFRIEGDHAYGPGVLDMKGGIIITLWTIKALEYIGFTDRPVRICFCGDEEGGSDHGPVEDIFRNWTDGCIAGFDMETSPIDHKLCVGRKYVMTGKAVIHGISAHSGNNYEAGRNAITEAAHKVIAIQNMNNMELGTHMNPAVISGGTVANAIPGECTLTFSGRFRYKTEIERVKQELHELFSSSVIEGTTSEYTLTDQFGGFETSVKTDENGNVTEILCSVDLDSFSGSEGANRKVKGTLHWLSDMDAVPAEVRLYEPLINDEEPETEADTEDKGEDAEENDAPKGINLNINPDSLTVLQGALVEPSIAACAVGDRFQFLRTGYFCKDPDSTDALPVYNRIVPLKDSWAKQSKN